MIGYTNSDISNIYLPDFNYTGNYTLLNEGNGNWKLKLLTSGTLVFYKFKKTGNNTDLFAVGGGGAGGVGYSHAGHGQLLPSEQYLTYSGDGGGGGYTATIKNVIIDINTEYHINIGPGGYNNNSGGQSWVRKGNDQTPFFRALGGKTGFYDYPSIAGDPELVTSPDGGSGGAAPGGRGGSDGLNGGRYTAAYNNVGIGQGTTTREFGDIDGQLYAGGGGGILLGSFSGVGGAGGGGNAGYYDSGEFFAPQNGQENTGGGGGGFAINNTGDEPITRVFEQTHGGSGIVIIRNHR